jgi:hypothetical protein
MRAPLHHKDFTVEPPVLTRREAAALKRLQKLAEMWPSTLSLQSWSGSLHVLKPVKGMTIGECMVARILGIPNDGGDPNASDVI